jgi:hypothetical protein
MITGKCIFAEYVKKLICLMLNLMGLSTKRVLFVEKDHWIMIVKKRKNF